MPLLSQPQTRYNTRRARSGGHFLDIREFYGDESDLKPGKKGISINQEQVSINYRSTLHDIC